MESPVGDLPELGREMQVVVGVNGRNVAEIGGEMRQLRTGVLAVVVTASKGGDRHAVAKVMQGGWTSAGIEDPGADAQVSPKV